MRSDLVPMHNAMGCWHHFPQLDTGLLVPLIPFNTQYWSSFFEIVYSCYTLHVVHYDHVVLQ